MSGAQIVGAWPHEQQRHFSGVGTTLETHAKMRNFLLQLFGKHSAFWGN